MAIVMEGFSIREYTSKMRSTDVEKCWPFGKASEEVVRATLPPMTVEKFSWWFDKLGLAHRDDEDDDGDETLESFRRKRGKAKAKAPKKRSVVELFAAVPPVERVSYSSEDGEVSGDGDPVPKKKAGKEKVVMLKDLKRDKVSKKKKDAAVESTAVKKKDKASSKLKLHSSADVVTTCNSSTHRKDLFDGFATHLKKPRMKRSSPQKSKFKTSSNYKFFPNDQHKAGSAVRGSLKTHSSLVASENCSNPLLPDASNSSNCDNGNADKHVSLSAMKDVLRPRWKACPKMKVSDLGMNSDFVIDSSSNSHVSTNIVMNHTEEERARFSKDKFVVRQVTEKPVSSRHCGSDGSNYSSKKPDYSQASLFSKLSVPYGEGSQHSRSHGRVTLHEESYSCSYEFPSVPKEPYSHSRDSLSSNPRLLDLSGCAGPLYDTDSSMDFTRNYPRPPTTYHSPAYNNVTRNRFFPSMSHYDQALSSQWMPHLSPQQTIHSICSLPDWSSRASSSRYKETSFNKNFVGLPLNSLGELRGRDGFIHARNAVEGPSYSSGMHRNVLSNPNRIEHCLTDLYGVGKRNSDKDAFDPCLNLIDSVVERLKVFHIDCRPRDHVQELRGNDVIRKPDHHISLQVTRSTMRLMGKNFTVEDSEGSTAKHTSTKPSSSISCHEKSPRYVVHPILGKLRETVSDFPKPKTNPGALENNPKSKVSSQFLSSHNNVRSNQNDVTKGKEMLMPEFHPQGSLPCSPSPNSYKYSTLSSAHHSHPESSCISIPTSTLSGSGQNARRRSNVPGAGKYFPSKVPFSDATSDRRVVHPPWSQNSLRGVAPYVLTSRDRRTLMKYCHPSSVLDSTGYPCSVSGANYGTKRGSAISRPQSFQARPGFSTPARRGPRYFHDNQAQSRLGVCVPVPGHGGKSKRRLPSAALNIGNNKPPKIPKIRVQDDCSNVVVVDLEASSSFQGDFEPSSSVQSVVNEPVGAPPNSGPVKMTAGSRYVLKPSRKNDLVNSEPSNSTSRVHVASNAVECEKSSEARMF